MAQDENYILKRRLIASQLAAILHVLFTFFVNLATKIVLARLLLPEDFGLFALVILFFSGIDAMRELGIGNNLIRSREDKYYGNAILINIISSLFWMIIVFLAGNVFSRFDPRMPVIMNVYIILTLLNSFSQMAGIYLRKNLFIAKALPAKIISTLIYLASAIFLAIKGFGVFSLVYAQLISGAVLALLLWHVFTKHIKPQYTFAFTKELIKTSRHFLGLGILLVILPQLDYGILGFTVSIDQVGYYFMALGLVALCYKYITPLFYHYVFPLFSKVQDDTEKLYGYYKLMTTSAMMLIVPICAFLFFNAKDVVLILYGEKWLQAAFALKALALWPIIAPYVLFGDDVINIKNEKVTFYSYVLYFICFAVTGYILILKMGILGCILAKYISETAASLPRLHKLYGIFKGKPIFFTDYLVIYFVPFIMFFVMQQNIYTGMAAFLGSYVIYFVIFRKKFLDIFYQIKENISAEPIGKEFFECNV